MHQLVYGAVVHLRRRGNLSIDTLREHLSRTIDERLSSSASQFTIWSQLRLHSSLTDTFPNLRFKYHTVTIELAQRLPKKLDINPVLNNGIHAFSRERYRNSPYIICRTSARNHDDAGKRIFDAIDVFLSLSNVLWTNWNLFGLENKPDIKLDIGPYQFMWKGKKYLGDDCLWYTPSFNEASWFDSVKSYSDFIKIAPPLRNGLKSLEALPLERLAVQSLKLMNEGLKSHDALFRVARLWSALETLFGDPSGSTRSDTIIRRAMFGEKGNPVVKAQLEYIASLRNQFVHAGAENDNLHYIVQMLRDFVGRHIRYLIYRCDDITSHRDYLAMCDLPYRPEDLERAAIALQRKRNIVDFGRHKGSD